MHFAVDPLSWCDAGEPRVVHKGIGQSAAALFDRLAATATAFAATGHSIVLVGHSLGAGTAALLAWLLHFRGGVPAQSVRALALAPPPCASPTAAQDLAPLVLSCVMRHDAIPRMTPRMVGSLEEELLQQEWEEMEQVASEWGPFGKALFERARCGSACARLRRFSTG